NLQPETGKSYSFAAAWERGSLSAKASFWHVEMANRISGLAAQAIVNAESLFPQFVQRDASGNIVGIQQIFVNFGELKAEGIDLDVGYRLATPLGTFTPALSATVTTRFLAAVRPGDPLVDRLNMATASDAWAPKWKATARMGWQRDAFSANV